MDLLAQIVAWLNAVANALGRWTLAPLAVLPGWLSATLVAAVTGVLFLAVFKYTSNQRAIKRARDDIKANLLALKLFKESARVALRAQGRILWGAARLFVYALVPMAVMAVPATLILGQLALWYQSCPLKVGEDAVVTVKLNGDAETALPEVSLQPTDAIEVVTGPVRVPSQREVCWDIKARQAGYRDLQFQVAGQIIHKQLAVGDGFMRVSLLRPGESWSDRLLHPWEQPFGTDGPVRSIQIDYPERVWWKPVPAFWVIYWFIVSLVAAFCFKPLLKVNV